MASTEKTPAEEAATDTAGAGRSADFGIDTTSKSTSEAVRDYLNRLRGGDLGALPSLLGLLALFILFSALAPVTFPSLLNLANLLQQGAGNTIIAMGLVFVLLTGEIDLATGTASGLCAALMALHLVSGGNLLGAIGTTVFVVVAAVLLAAVVLAVLLRIWVAAAMAALAVVLIVVGFPPNPWLEMLLAICVGVAIGTITGFLVSWVGMPSFVVTLALFIAWQGVILQLIGEGGTLGLRDPVINAVANGNLSTVGSWVLFVVGRGRLRGGAAQPAIPQAQAGPGRAADRAGADQDRGGRGVLGRSRPSCSRSIARSAPCRSQASRMWCRSCSHCSSRARSCWTARGSAGTSTPWAATARPRAARASTSSRSGPRSS